MKRWHQELSFMKRQINRAKHHPKFNPKPLGYFRKRRPLGKNSNIPSPARGLSSNFCKHEIKTTTHLHEALEHYCIKSFKSRLLRSCR